MKMPSLSKGMRVRLIVVPSAYLLCLEVCARTDAATVVLGAGRLTSAASIFVMVALVALRLHLFLVMPGYIAARAVAFQFCGTERDG